MRLVEYFNYPAFFLFAAAALLYLANRFGKHDPETYRINRIFTGSIPLKAEIPAAAVLLLAGCLLRLWHLDTLPLGLQQDEASIGYEAYSLLNYGMDRNGYIFPVYPVTWGSGGGSPLMIYLNVIMTALLGSNVLSLRLVPALCGILTLVVFYLFVRRTLGNVSALIGLLVLSLTPWHIMLSRWSLDSNTAPLFEILGIYLLTLAMQSTERKRKTLFSVLSCITFSVSLYSYGSFTFCVPVFLLIMTVCTLRRKQLGVRDILAGLFFFLLFAVPIGLFYAVNYLGLPEICTPYFSVPAFTSDHTGSVFLSIGDGLPAALLKNLVGLLRLISVGNPGEVTWNAMPEYSCLYHFTLPSVLLGLYLLIRICRSSKQEPASSGIFSMLIMLLVSAVFALFVQQDINRTVLLYLPCVYCLTAGMSAMLDFSVTVFRKISPLSGQSLSDRIRALLCLTVLPVFLMGSLFFLKDYYGGRYAEYASSDFMPGYGEAISYAETKTEGDSTARVISTYTDVASPFMLALYYCKYDPRDFQSTVVYKDPDAEFRVASSFGNFTFGFPEDLLQDGKIQEERLKAPEYSSTVFVVNAGETAPFEYLGYDITRFGNFAVAVPSGH